MFIGEAPGRLGADDSQIPFHGDKSGHNFESLVEQVGLSRYQIFVTNAVLCNPKDSKGNNSTPNASEIANCAPFLSEQIELLKPKVIVTLGAVALRSADQIQPHGLTLKGDVRTSRFWKGALLIPNYHPGQRAMIHRSFANQLADYQFIAESARRIQKPTSRRKTVGNASERVTAVVDRITLKKPSLSYFALHKLFFLAEVKQLEETGRRLTSAYVVRQKDGPYCVELHPARIATRIPGLTFRSGKQGIEVIRVLQSEIFPAGLSKGVLTAKELASIDSVVAKYGSLSNADLKRVAYLATPMRELLRKEKTLRVNLFNSPILPLY